MSNSTNPSHANPCPYPNHFGNNSETDDDLHFRQRTYSFSSTNTISTTASTSVYANRKLHVNEYSHNIMTVSPTNRPVEVDTSSLSPSSNAARYSDASVGHVPTRGLTPPPPPPPPPPTQHQPTDVHITPESSSSGYFKAGIGNSPYPSYNSQNSHAYHQPSHPNTSFRSPTNPNSGTIPNNLLNRFNLRAQPSSHFAMNQRLTMTEPVHQLSPTPDYFYNNNSNNNNNNDIQQQQQRPTLSDNHLPPAVSDNSTPEGDSNITNIEHSSTNPISNNNQNNSNNSNSTSTDLSLPSSRLNSLGDIHEPTTILSDQDPASNNAPEFFDPASLGHSRASDVDWQVSSAEPSALHAGASLHIDENGLDYNFVNEGTKIGQGTYGSVYIGQYFGENVAIKRIRIPSANPNISDDPFVLNRHTDAIRQFAREIRKYERVSHPGIVRFFGVTLPKDEPSALLVTEFMAGDSLSEAMRILRVNNTQFDTASVVRIALQACGGLRALHDQNCTWGDAKPENILLTERLREGVFPPTGDARIADFGLSKSAAQTLLADTTIGGSGQPAGSYRYMSPESFSLPERDNLQLSKSSDIYSFGVVIYEMITLRVPWKRRTMNEVLLEVRRGNRPEWPAENDEDYHGPINPNLKQVVEQCWLPDYNKRPSAEQIFNALENSLRDVSSNSTNNVDQRPLSVLDEGTSISNVNNAGEIREPSIVSTVVPIGGSVEFGSQALESTTESRRIGDIPDDAEFGLDAFDEAVFTDGAESAPVQMTDRRSHGILPRPTTHAGVPGSVVPANPTVSPVTSPEPRSKRNSYAGDDTTPQDDSEEGITKLANNLQQFDFQNTNGSLGTESQTAAVKHIVDNRLHSNDNNSSMPMMNARLQTRDRYGNVIGNDSNNPDAIPTFKQYPNAAASIGQASTNSFINAESALISGEFIKNRAKFAQELGRFAEDGPHDTTTDEDGGEGISQAPVSSPLVPTPSGNLTWNNAVTNGTIMSSQPTSSGSNLMISSNMSSVGSSARKRSTNVQGIIEAAAKEFLAYRKLKASRITPQKKREIDQKKKEEAEQIKSEKESLSNIDRCDESGSYSGILQEMKDNHDSQCVVRAGMAALEKYCNDENLFLEICEEGGVEELVSGAALHGKNESGISISFCKCILSLSGHGSDKVSHILRAVGVPSLVIEKMHDHRTNVEIQKIACETLASVAASSELSRSAVATLGGPAAVYLAMTKNNASFHNADLARSALKAIRYIAQDNEKAAEYLVQVSALDTVSRAAEVFTDHGIEGDILSALRAFSFYDGGRRNVIMSSGLKALTQIMVRNTEPEFLVQCCTFIRAIARWRDHECEAAMLESCISSRIVLLMQMSNDIPGEEGAKVAWYSSHACTFLASFGSRSRLRLRDEGAIETAIAILNQRKENARVVHSATDALAELLKGEEESKRHAKAHHVTEALNAALVTHRNVVRVRKALEWTLNYLNAPPRLEPTVPPQFPQNGGGDHSNGAAHPGSGQGGYVPSNNMPADRPNYVHGQAVPMQGQGGKRRMFRWGKKR